jgi:hypothetical protein
MNIHLDVAILIFGDSNHYFNEKKQCANEIVGLVASVIGLLTGVLEWRDALIIFMIIT